MSSSKKSLRRLRYIQYLAGFPGADLERDVVQVQISGTDVSNIPSNIDEIGGQPQSAVDVASRIDDIFQALSSQDGDSLLIDNNNALDVTASTVPTEQQTPVGVEDSGGNQIDPDQSPEYPNEVQQQDLIATGDLSVTVQVARSEALIISGHSDDSNAWSASVTWEDGSGNTLQTESNVDIGLDSVTDDWARLVRKGPEATVVFTDESGGTNNNVNVFLDTHR